MPSTALDELSPKRRTALIPRWRYGYRVTEIAKHMTLSNAMVKKYLARGLAHFRNRLHRYKIADRAA